MGGESRTSDCGRNGKAERAGSGETSGASGRNEKTCREKIYNRLNGLNKEDFLATLATIKQELQDGRTWETATTKKLNKCVR